jgi:hypothetical protein
MAREVARGEEVWAYVAVSWNGDGSYTPTCEICAWEGKPRWVHSDALSAVRSHRLSRRHREGLGGSSFGAGSRSG